MAMNFWLAQQRARRKTCLYLAIFALLTIAIACLSEGAMHLFGGENYDPPLPLVGMAFLAITFFVAACQYLLFRAQGGSYVAESMGAILLTKEDADVKEMQLLNIVEEIALASSIPIPPVYLIDVEEINAFAAGLSHEDASITVTWGALQHLTRDELQGVIAHEFGHIYNGDMVIGMRLAAMIMGFYFVLYIALRLIQFSPMRSPMRSQKSDRKDNGGNLLLVAALILVIAGAFTWLAGTILKCIVSRQREYLADASSVQFTRNPQPLANALRKIASTQVHDMPKSGIAFSHLYFQDSGFFSSIFATHPPLEKRIAAIEATKE